MNPLFSYGGEPVVPGRERFYESKPYTSRNLMKTQGKWNVLRRRSRKLRKFRKFRNADKRLEYFRRT